MTTVNEWWRENALDGRGRQRATVSITPAQLFARSSGLTLPCQADPELWFADTPSQVEQAKALCRGCALQVDCVAAALDRGEPWGVWGGQLLANGRVVARNQPRGRPRKVPTIAGPVTS